MAKKILGGLALAASLLVVLVVAYRFYFKGPSPEPPPRDVQFRTVPEFAQKPAPPEPGAPPAQEQPASPQAKATPPAAKAPAPPGLKPPTVAEAPVAPPEPEKQFGLLVGRYRTYKQAGKVLEKLKKQENPAFVRHEGRQRKPYEVWAGPFPDEKEAQAAAQSIKQKLKLSPKLAKLQLPVPK